MKQIINFTAISVFILLPFILLAQPLPYDPGVGGGTGSSPVGGGAPMGEGIILLLTMSIVYGVKNVYNFKKADKS